MKTISISVVIDAKRHARAELRKLQNNEPLNMEQVALMLRGYIGMLELIESLVKLD